MESYKFSKGGINVEVTAEALQAYARQQMGCSDGARPRALDIPRIGELWEGQGGRLVGMIRGVDEEDGLLIKAEDPRGNLKDVAWGAYGKTLGCSNQWDGRKNMPAMLKAKLPIALAFKDLEIEGHRDYYLMARREGALCYANLGHLIPDGAFWMSTECSAYDAWCQLFSYGTQYSNHKDNAYSAFAVRRVPFSSLVA